MRVNLCCCRMVRNYLKILASHYALPRSAVIASPLLIFFLRKINRPSPLSWMRVDLCYCGDDQDLICKSRLSTMRNTVLLLLPHPCKFS